MTDADDIDDIATELFGASPFRDAASHAHDVGIVLDGLNAIANGECAYSNFSHLLCSLDRGLDRRSRRLGDEDQEMLAGALQLALEAAWVSLPRSYPRSHLTLGVAAARRAIDLWARPDPARLAGGEYVNDVRQCMRIFRNHMHNLVLLDEIASRAASRASKRTDIVRSMIPPSAADMDTIADDLVALFKNPTLAHEGELA
jgi:hypothetical protein